MLSCSRFVTLALVASLAAASSASIVSYSASAVQETATANMRYGPDPYGNNLLHVWNERQGFTLTSALTVDAVANGAYTTAGQLGTFVLAAGTRVNSQFLMYDPVSNSQTGSVTFSGRIIGVIVTSQLNSGDRLSLSDYLRPAGTTAFAHYTNRGLEMNPDAFTISGNTLTVDLSAASPGDSIRILTAVPGPAALLPFALGLVVRRKRR